MTEPQRVKRGPPFKADQDKKTVGIHARLSTQAHAKLLRLMAPFGGEEKRGALTAALEAAILAAPDP